MDEVGEIACKIDKCGEKCSCIEILINHTKDKHSNEEIFVCCFCLRQFDKLWKMRRHVVGCTLRFVISSLY